MLTAQHQYQKLQLRPWFNLAKLWVPFLSGNEALGKTLSKQSLLPVVPSEDKTDMEGLWGFSEVMLGGLMEGGV